MGRLARIFHRHTWMVAEIKLEVRGEIQPGVRAVVKICQCGKTQFVDLKEIDESQRD